MQKRRIKPVGLGDTLANLTFITGIDVTVKKIGGLLGVEDCGCAERQKKLNKLFPYKDK